MNAQLLTAIIAGLTLVATLVGVGISLHTKNEVLQLELRLKAWVDEEFERKPDLPPAGWTRRRHSPEAS